MKVIGLSCGRNKGNSEVLLQISLHEVEQITGAAVEMIRLQALNIRNCIGCETCMRGLTTDGDGKCVLTGDDFCWLAEEVSDADGIILASPIYNLIPPGAVVTLLNRTLGIGKKYQQQCRANPKLGGIIALGGSDWVNLAEPILDLTLCNLSKGAIVIDRMICQYSTAPAMVLLDESAVHRAQLLGQRIGQALLDREHATYQGDPGVCPICHCNLLEWHQGNQVHCPYCNAQGTLQSLQNSVVIDWDANSLLTHRFSPAGEQSHRADIRESHKRAAANRALILEKLAEISSYWCDIKSPQK